MSFIYQQELPSPEALIREFPMAAALQKIKADRDAQIRACMDGTDDRLLMIIGPCSAHEEEAVCEYIRRLAEMENKVKERLVLIPRIYTNKPRTTGEGYKGMLHQPDPSDKPNMLEGLRAIRRLHLRALKESGLSAADEMLYPGNHPYLDDVLSYVAVGARSSENQQHRLTAGGLDIPVGIKNPTSGDMPVLINSIRAAQTGHVFIYNGRQVETSGNPFAHAVLRGGFDRHGNHIPNYHFENLVELAEAYSKSTLVNPAVIIDTNHSNSGKKYEQQPRIALEVMLHRKHSQAVRGIVKGFMIESFLEPGAQSLGDNVFGKSITDPCLGWQETEEMLLRIADAV
jgi:3-deoxy-7-phosphoheptulonate synthase